MKTNWKSLLSLGLVAAAFGLTGCASATDVDDGEEEQGEEGVAEPRPEVDTNLRTLSSPRRNPPARPSDGFRGLRNTLRRREERCRLRTDC